MGRASPLRSSALRDALADVDVTPIERGFSDGGAVRSWLVALGVLVPVGEARHPAEIERFDRPCLRIDEAGVRAARREIAEGAKAAPNKRRTPVHRSWGPER